MEAEERRVMARRRMQGKVEERKQRREMEERLKEAEERREEDGRGESKRVMAEERSGEDV